MLENIKVIFIHISIAINLFAVFLGIESQTVFTEFPLEISSILGIPEKQSEVIFS